MNELVEKIISWNHDRNLIHGSDDKSQMCKLMEEMGELASSVAKGKDITDDLGDMMVVMINIMTRNQLTMEDCLAKAYDDIKDRTGVMRDGIFIKDE
jgi:NTP pyrophosphatase (non-canonical NTP hydrolase)